jgi:hypothetical protein
MMLRNTEKKISMFFKHISVVLLPTLKIMVASQDWWDTANRILYTGWVVQVKWRGKDGGQQHQTVGQQSCGLWNHVVMQLNQCSKRTCYLHLCGHSECSMYVDKLYMQDDTNCGHPETMKLGRRKQHCLVQQQQWIHNKTGNVHIT